MTQSIRLDKYHLPNVVRAAQALYRALSGCSSLPGTKLARAEFDLLDAMTSIYTRRTRMGLPVQGFNPNAPVSRRNLRWMRSLGAAESLAARLRIERKTGCVKPTCGFMRLIEDLLTLSERVPYLAFSRKTGTLWIHTMPVVLPGVPLSWYRLALATGRKDFLDHTVIPLRIKPVHVKTVEAFEHPHIRNEVLDFGELAGQTRTSLSSGRILEFFLLTFKALRKYTPSAAYHPLKTYSTPEGCHHCGDKVFENPEGGCPSPGAIFCTRLTNGVAPLISSNAGRSITEDRLAESSMSRRVPPELHGVAPGWPSVRFNLYAWAKLWFFCGCKAVEFTGYGVLADEQELLIVDILLPDQRATSRSVGHTARSMEKLLERAKRLGYRRDQVGRIWIHSHTDETTNASVQDQLTFNKCFDDYDWSLMIIISRKGGMNCQMRMNRPDSMGFGAVQQKISGTVDMTVAFKASDLKSWKAEYEKHVKVKPAK